MVQPKPFLSHLFLPTLSLFLKQNRKTLKALLTPFLELSKVQPKLNRKAHFSLLSLFSCCQPLNLVFVSFIEPSEVSYMVGGEQVRLEVIVLASRCSNRMGDNRAIWWGWWGLEASAAVNAGVIGLHRKTGWRLLFLHGKGSRLIET